MFIQAPGKRGEALHSKELWRGGHRVHGAKQIPPCNPANTVGMHPLMLGAMGQQGEAGEGENKKISLKICSVGEG